MADAGKGKGKSYKYCIVPKCRSTSVKTPNKIFITLPRDPKVRMRWQKAMKRVNMISNHATCFVCEDHFNLEEDMQNYLYFKLMENVQIKIKPNVLPRVFDCQISRTAKRSKKVRRAFLKRQYQSTPDENFAKPSTSKKSQEDGDAYEEPDLANSDLGQTHVKERIQVNITPKMVSKEV